MGANPASGAAASSVDSASHVVQLAPNCWAAVISDSSSARDHSPASSVAPGAAAAARGGARRGERRGERRGDARGASPATRASTGAAASPLDDGAPIVADGELALLTISANQRFGCEAACGGARGSAGVGARRMPRLGAITAVRAAQAGLRRGAARGAGSCAPPSNSRHCSGTLPGALRPLS